jgi:hypothetical protein
VGESKVNSELQRFDETREALLAALGARLGRDRRLDGAAGLYRRHAQGAGLDEAVVKARLEDLLQVYRNCSTLQWRARPSSMK